jgi:hypothetical protein
MTALAPYIVALTDILMPIVMLTIWLALCRARIEGPSQALLAVPLVVALIWGSLWAFWPPLAALRLAPPPAGQATAVLLLVGSLVGLLLLPIVRRYFRTAKPMPLIAIGVWRLIYGALLLAIGLGGGLPSGFFWSAALGDMAVGVWAIAILWRGSSVANGEIIAWNLAGLLDFIHVVVLGRLHLATFFLANPDLPPVNLLPLAGVPVLMSLHILMLWGLLARRGLSTRRAAV